MKETFQVQPGARLGPYEIVAPIGAGGMGEVYRARDTRLGRDVAIKVLPAEFASDPDRLRRFELEARAVAALSHPNILAIHDVGTHEGSPYLVTELLEGETLRERLQGGALPVRKAVDIAVQIAHGLAAAHEKGIVHRDLKPGNVFVTKDGHVKILDFGLAKLAPPRKPEERARATTVMEATDAGTVLGTVSYMSPEQVRGQSVDHRTDIFSFGCVLYEMLSGRRAFTGDAAADTMSAILTKDPEPLSGTGRDVPPVLQGMVSRCLEKSPEDRFQSARDLAFDLALLARISDTGTGLRPEAPLRPRRVMRRWVAVAAAAVAIGVGLFLITRGTSRAPVPSFKRITLRRGTVDSARFTPDFQSVVYSASWEGKPAEVFVQRLASADARSLGVFKGASVMGTNGGDVVILRGGGTLAQLPLEGGTPRDLLKDITDVAFDRGGNRVAITRLVEGHPRVEFPIGKVLLETRGLEWTMGTCASPDGQRLALLFQSAGQTGGGTCDVRVAERSGQWRTLSKGWLSICCPRWSPDGNEIWFSATRAGFANELHAVTLSGAERLVTRLPGGADLQDIAPDGRVLLTFGETRRWELRGRMAGDSGERDLSWLDGTLMPTLAPDGTQMVFQEWGEGGGPAGSTYHWRMDGSTPKRLGDGGPYSVSPDWTTALVTVADSGGRSELKLVPIGAGETTTLPRGPIHEYNWGYWNPDGKRIVLSASDAEGKMRLWVQDVAGGPPRPFAQPEALSISSLTPFSPDGRFIAAKPSGGAPYALYPIDGGNTLPVPFLRPDEVPIVFSDDGKSLFVTPAADRSKFPVHVLRLDLKTGKRDSWLDLAPPDRAGVPPFLHLVLTPNGRFYTYDYIRALSDLYLIEGLK